ncbi:MAG: Nif3-like dinuclear metal center hexameric protein [Chitinophagaceae bacterium]|nr:Nif3-like dinuclear metal center hexameric protein [Chitinophagaceae bacterium]
MKIQEIIKTLEDYAPPVYQEPYDNAGLLTGDNSWECTGVICTLDCTEKVIREAKVKNCNLIVAHHPIIFGGLKKITGRNYVERTVIAAIKNDIAIYAIHTNLDNVYNGVSQKMADVLGLKNCRVLQPKKSLLVKLFTYVPYDSLEKVRNALFEAGAGKIGNYSECSFGMDGTGTFKAGAGADPYIGEIGKLSVEKEVKLEVILPAHIQKQVITAMIKAHPYEEVAYDVIYLDNENQQVGSGIIGELEKALSEAELLRHIKEKFNLAVIRHTPLLNKEIKKVALCGGAGSFLVSSALAAGADIYITADMKYHEFFDANDRMIIADIGHWESEQYTTDLLADILRSKFPTFAVLKSEAETNPVNYF